MKTTPIFPTTIEELQTNPAMIEHWPHVKRLFIGYLLTMQFNNGLNGTEAGSPDHAVGAARALSRVIEHAMKIGDDAPPPKTRPNIAPLHRFSENQPGENTKPNTPAK